jgi:hypothetical protein
LVVDERDAWRPAIGFAARYGLEEQMETSLSANRGHDGHQFSELLQLDESDDSQVPAGKVFAWEIKTGRTMFTARLILRTRH